MTLKNRRPRSLHASISESTTSAIALGAGETYLSALGVFLKATSIQIGLLATLPPFLGALAQMLGLWLIDRGVKRLRLIVTAISVNSAVLILIALLPWFPPDSINLPILLIGLACVYFVALEITVPSWTSLIGDLVPRYFRSQFISIRSRRYGIFSFVAIVFAGKTLEVFDRLGLSAIGFTLIFVIAAGARVLSARFFRRHSEPSYDIRIEHRFSFWRFLLQLPRSNFALFVLFFACMNFGVTIAGPYFALYMLRDLKLSYLDFTLITASAVAAQFITMRHWGSISQRYGSKSTINFCSYGVSAVPFLWLASTNVYYLMVVQAFSGFVWAGFNLATLNFLFDAVSPPKRARCAAYRSIINATFILLGSLLGAALLRVVPTQFPMPFSDLELQSKIPYLFILSGTVRFAVSGFLLSRFREVRAVGPHSPTEVLVQAIYMRPIVGAFFSIVALPGRSEKRRRITLI